MSVEQLQEDPEQKKKPMSKRSLAQHRRHLKKAKSNLRTAMIFSPICFLAAGACFYFDWFAGNMAWSIFKWILLIFSITTIFDIMGWKNEYQTRSDFLSKHQDR